MRSKPGPASRTSSRRKSGAGPSQSPTKASDGGSRGGVTPCAAMSPTVRSSSTTKRAKWSRSNRPNGRTAFSGSTTPGRWFIEARRARRAPSRPATMGATTAKLDCGVTTRSELQGEVHETLLVPVDLTQVEPGADLPDLVADPLGDQGGVRVVE